MTNDPISDIVIGSPEIREEPSVMIDVDNAVNYYIKHIEWAGQTFKTWSLQ